MSNDSPLGTPIPDPTDTTGPAHSAVIGAAVPSADSIGSIVDTILNLDELLSGDVRRAERVARICTRPDLEARLDELEAHLQDLPAPQGRSVDRTPGGDRALGQAPEGDPADPVEAAARAVAEEIEQVRAEMTKSMHAVRMRQVSDDDWAAFEQRHKAALDEGEPFPRELIDDLIVMSACEPKITPEKMTGLRGVLGSPAILELAKKAWTVNTESGVSVPKSRASLAVLRHARRATS